MKAVDTLSHICDTAGVHLSLRTDAAALPRAEFRPCVHPGKAPPRGISPYFLVLLNPRNVLHQTDGRCFGLYIGPT